VLATMQGAPGPSTLAGTPASSVQVSHVMASSARLQHDAKLAEFHGSDAEPARLWQGASQVEAASLFFDGDRHTLAARAGAAGAVVHAVFAGAASRKESGRTNVVRVASQRMDYDDLQREAIFAGTVRIDGTMGNVRAQRAVVFLQPAVKATGDGRTPAASSQATAPANPFSGSIDKVVISGDVVMEQPERHGTGDQLVYTAASDSYVLTGTPGRQPKVVDTKQGSVTGTTLLFGDAGSTIVVAGEPGSDKPNRGRVRTETEVRK